ncbi:NAD(P)-dependent oxidoreductase [Terribacillus sp. 179-K 1B1 HS]|uniref:NAD-dependent epimerase/dehydratase family protein n=1 Tax=Terribacillus sp. 179-K 1B1 HS TaxID=3142388 RepID=UPI0039A38088
MKSLITGAAGHIGKNLAKAIYRKYDLVLTDVKEDEELHRYGHFIQADLANAQETEQLMDGIDAIVHLGAIATESTYEKIQKANFDSTFHIYEAARKHGIKRIVFASSNHAVGFHPINQSIGPDAPHLPDTFYGASKAFGENLANMYHKKHGIETASLRIGSYLEKPAEHRNLNTWISVRDMNQLIVRCLEADRIGTSVFYGVSSLHNDYFDNRDAAKIGYAPEDNPEDYREKIENVKLENVTDYIGGMFTNFGR